jgi:ligand-binding sensor domain-containing protein
MTIISYRAFFLLVLATLLLAGCAGVASPVQPSPLPATPVEAPTAADAATATLTPAAADEDATARTPTLEPIVLPVSPTPTPSPTREPSAWTSYSNLDDVQDLFQASDGRIWAATSGGVVVWDLAAPTYTILRVEDGLPANDARAIAETPDGDMWIGTASGLARYHEGSIVGFLGADALGSADIQALLTDSQGRLWVGTRGAGAVRYDGENWQPLHFSTSPQANNVLSIYEDEAGRLWFGGMGLARLDGETWEVLNDPAVSGRGILAIATDRAGARWFGTPFDLVRYVDGAFKAYSFPRQALHTINDIWQDPQGRLWLGTEKGGVWMVDGAEWRQLTAADGLPATSVRRFVVLPSYELLLATDQGILKQTRDGWRPYLVGNAPAGNDIRALLVDANGILWVAARGKPLSMYNGVLWQELGEAQSQRPNNVSALAQTADGVVWAAEPGRGVWRVQDQAATLLTARDGLASDQVTGLGVDAAGNLWVSTMKGVSRWDGERWTSYTQREGLPATESVVLAAGGDAAGQGVAWVGALKDGVARYQDGAWAAFGAAEGLPTARPLSMAADGEGVWLGYAATRVGAARQLAHFDGASWAFITAEQGLPAADPLALLDEAGWLWVGTDGLGLARYADGIWERWTPADGLASGKITALATDGAGVLWIGSSAGLTRLDTTLLD